MPQAAALVRILLLGAIWLYRLVVSPIFYALGARCRFHPSCSESTTSLRPSVTTAPWQAARRIRAAHPLDSASVDPFHPGRGRYDRCASSCESRQKWINASFSRSPSAWRSFLFGRSGLRRRCRRRRPPTATVASRAPSANRAGSAGGTVSAPRRLPGRAPPPLRERTRRGPADHRRARAG